ncbi:MAG: CHASE2 domain-containing protein [Leptolyngbya sp. IPPAS B-1204]|nr:CHASE2 domain-containing protein [Elainella sp. C42_A2020_010]RNJ66888.1 MAG: CHASE2 domain-containing protein [Leptolyngbya sp. IPPAS B-1204]
MLESLLRKRYKLVSVLGAGGFGQTYLAEDTENPELPRCVVKQFKPVKDDQQFLSIARRLFDTEVKMLEQLGQHPQIPTFLNFFEENGEFYLVQEFIDGQPLSEELSPAHRLTEAEAIELLRDVLGILVFVHSQQVIHRDIKPSNLIRRKADGQFVLIDFGAVKEIGTQLLSETEQKFTVGIGTQGYTPSEQLAGRPRYCSDIYALGMTVIQSLTGTQPTQLLADPETGDLLWQTQAMISSGLRSILEKMVRYHFSQRYQSAQEVLQALDRLAEAPLESTMMPSSLVMPTALLHHPIADQMDRTIVDTPVRPVKNWRSQLRKGIQIVAVAAVAVTGLLAGLRQMAWLEAPELAVYDHWVRWRPDAGIDPRLLIVEISESDLQTLRRGTPSDRDVAQVIQKLRQYQPRVIGLDLHRDLPQEPGHAELMQQLQFADVITIMKLGNGQSKFDIPPPAGVPPERLGFNDFPIDPDNVLRRSLLYGTNAGQRFSSFSLRLATRYLKPSGLIPKRSDRSAEVMQLGDVNFWPLNPSFGGYQQLDAAGYQVMLNYRSPKPPARQVTFTQVLNGQVDPAWVKDKVVLIGTTAASGKDLFYTPFSSGKSEEHLMAGVVVHAQMVSQILSVALDGTPLIWAWPDWAELLWIGGWAMAGGSLAWFVRHPFLFIMGTAGMLIVLVGTTFIIFTHAGWLPSVAPAIALVLTGVTVVSWRSYQLE